MRTSPLTAFRDGPIFAFRMMDHDRAHRLLDDGVRYAESTDQSHCRNVMAATSATPVVGRWGWTAAAQIARQTIADHGSRRSVVMARWAVGYVALGRGALRPPKRSSRAALAVGEESGTIDLILPPLWGLAEAALLADQPDRAAAHCRRALESARAIGERALLVPFVVTGVRAEQASGRPSAAAAWLDACAEHLAALPAVAQPALDHGRGLVAMAAGSTGIARVALEAAVQGWTDRGRVWEATWARLDLAECLGRLNRFADSMALTVEARATASRLDSRPLAQRADALHRNGSRPGPGRGAVAPVDRPRVRRGAADQRRADERRDRLRAVDRPEDRQQPRRAHPGQARSVAAGRDRRLGHGCRAGRQPSLAARRDASSAASSGCSLGTPNRWGPTWSRAMPTTTDTFTGFTPEAIQFLADLAENNDRAWFQPRKGEYERLLKEPLEALSSPSTSGSRRAGSRSRPIPTRSPFRIYRDVRFCKDKSPYKTNVAASFPWAEGGGADGPHGFGESGNPGGYFHLAPGEVYIGGGMWHPPTAKLAAFRAAVADDPKARPRLIDDPGFKRDIRRDLGRQADPRAVRLPEGPSRGRAAQAEGPDVRPPARRRRRVSRRGLPDLVADSSRPPFRSCAGSLGCDARASSAQQRLDLLAVRPFRGRSGSGRSWRPSRVGRG